MTDDELRTELERVVRRHRLSHEAAEDLRALVGLGSIPWTTPRGTVAERTWVEPTRPADVAPAQRQSGPPPGAPTIDQPAAEAKRENSGLREFDELRIQTIIGRGGVGEVWRVQESTLNRTLAIKTLRPEYAARQDLISRFYEEARVQAQLQHPGIIPVHCLAQIPDGRMAFTMPEIQGRSLRQVIQAVHRASRGDWKPDEHGWTFRRLLDAFHRVCETVAYAHSRGVIHRDLKPENVMVGSYGEVFVLDWGLAKVLEDDPTLEVSGEFPLARGTDDEFQTRVDAVIGTPQYMPPEQARGEIRQVGKASDIYALGGTLYEILAGHPPIRGNDVYAVLEAARRGDVAPFRPPGPVPPELEVILARAMNLEPADRYADATEMATAVADWLQGTRQQEEALKLVAEADEMVPQVLSCREEAQRFRSQAEEMLAGVRPHEPVDRKKPAWDLLSQAQRLEREASLRELEQLQRLRTALNLVPTLPEAHHRLADHYRDQLVAAEARRDEDMAVRAEVMLRSHDRGAHAELLRGDGRLVLHTDPPGAELWLHRYVEQDRRLLPAAERFLGTTPIDMSLPRGSYLLRICKEGYKDTLYPVHLERCGRWDGIPPGERGTFSIPLLRDLGADEVYVPAGWYVGGGDPLASDSLPRGRWWVNGVVVRRFPVTNAEYLAFLNALVAAGRAEEALSLAPRSAIAGGEGRPLWPRDAAGHFVLEPDAEGNAWAPLEPVCWVTWHAAAAFAAYEAERTGQPWRLLHSLEREKAGRGVDGRLFPWGDHFDPTWACVLPSHAGPPRRVPVTDYPQDVSPYGIRGLAGGSMDWCADAYRR
ncbi:MAG TPA: bifunctional serine/threonine-protein kinase/formylglycine-generating enzyme family protein, partial [Myxococcota bacterium]|nr:bifunctional serine/threonine-protein kinase/formylglycine-generating enzyme family protein [Myxococcota bacterium]